MQHWVYNRYELDMQFHFTYQLQMKSKILILGVMVGCYGLVCAVVWFFFFLLSKTLNLDMLVNCRWWVHIVQIGLIKITRIHMNEIGNQDR